MQDDNFKESGLYDTSQWNIDPDFPLPPDPSKKPPLSNTTNEDAEHATNVLHVEIALNKKEDEMEDKSTTRNLQAQMDFLGAKKLEEIEMKKKQKKKKRQAFARTFGTMCDRALGNQGRSTASLQ